MPDEDKDKIVEEGSPKITFGQFNEFFKVNSDLDNSEIYKAFPSVKEGTLRSWKAKAKTEAEKPPEVPEEPAPEPEGEEETPEEEPTTPMTAKEIADLVAEKVRETLKIDRMDPSEGIPTDEPVNRAVIAKNWHEVIV